MIAFPRLFIGMERSLAIGGQSYWRVIENIPSRTFFMSRLISY